MEDRREVCLEEEVARMRRYGMSAREISREMGVDEGWVESLISMPADEYPSTEDRGWGVVLEAFVLGLAASCALVVRNWAAGSLVVPGYSSE